MTIPIKLVPTTGTSAELREFAAADKIEIGNLPVVGTVADTGGVPSGAVIESTANYTKYADGSLIVRGVTAGIDQTIANQPYAVNFNFPAGVAFKDSSSYAIVVNVNGLNVSNIFSGYCRGAPLSATSFTIIQGWNYVQTYTYTYIAFGRWK